MKILIRGSGFENKGAEAMLKVVQRELGIRIPDAVFHASVSPVEAPFAYRSGIVPLFYAPSVRMQLLRTLPFAAKIPEILLSRKNPDFARAIKTHTRAAYEFNAISNVDAVVDVSGFSYSDSWGVGGFEYAWPWLEYCRIKKKPYVFLPQAWGPFEKADVAYWMKKFCATRPMIVSRDNESSKYLANIEGVSVDKVRQSPDIAFRFSGDPPTVGRSILDQLGLGMERPVIGLVPNMRVYERTPGTGAGNNYVKLLTTLADFCVSNLKTDVVLIPNEIKLANTYSPDDRFLCSIILAQVQNTKHCRALRDNYSAETVKSVLSQLDLLIASRFHSLVFSLDQTVPSLALGWSHKYQELLRLFDLENYVFDYEQLDSSAIIEIVEEAWQKRKETRSQLREKLPQLRASVDNLFNEISTYIKHFKN